MIRGNPAYRQGEGEWGYALKVSWHSVMNKIITFFLVENKLHCLPTSKGAFVTICKTKQKDHHIHSPCPFMNIQIKRIKVLITDQKHQFHKLNQ